MDSSRLYWGKPLAQWLYLCRMATGREDTSADWRIHVWHHHRQIRACFHRCIWSLTHRTPHESFHMLCSYFSVWFRRGCWKNKASKGHHEDHGCRFCLGTPADTLPAYLICIQQFLPYVHRFIEEKWATQPSKSSKLFCVAQHNYSPHCSFNALILLSETKNKKLRQYNCANILQITVWG